MAAADLNKIHELSDALHAQVAQEYGCKTAAAAPCPNKNNATSNKHTAAAEGAPAAALGSDASSWGGTSSRHSPATPTPRPATPSALRRSPSSSAASAATVSGCESMITLPRPADVLCRPSARKPW